MESHQQQQQKKANNLPLDRSRLKFLLESCGKGISANKLHAQCQNRKPVSDIL